MAKPTKDQPKRKSVTMPRSMWRDIAKFQTAERITTEAEALRRVVLAGLRSLGVGKKNASAAAEKETEIVKPEA